MRNEGNIYHIAQGCSAISLSLEQKSIYRSIVRVTLNNTK